MTSRRGRHVLTVKDVTKEDQGEYSFVVAGKKTTAQIKVKRKYFVLFIKISFTGLLLFFYSYLTLFFYFVLQLVLLQSYKVFQTRKYVRVTLLSWK